MVNALEEHLDLMLVWLVYKGLLPICSLKIS